ncbi:MAG: AI-2E family transporter [Tenericutes bacterium]|nr:AI-2E family transporter [Mycoplasmatota bacterium]
MFKKKTDSINYGKLNEGIAIGVSLLKIIFILTIVVLIFICSKLLEDWKILSSIGNVLSVISPLFIGIGLAWLFDPFVSYLNKKGVSRILGAIFVYIIFLSFIYLLLRLMIPSITNQLNDLAKNVPNFINYLKENIDKFFENLNNLGNYNFTDIKISIYDSINNLSRSLTIDLPKTIMNAVSNIISGSVNLLIGLLIGLYMLFDFDNVKKHLYSLIPKKYQDDTRTLLTRLNNNLKSYVHGTLLIMFILFVFQSIALAIAGLEAPMVFGLFCAVTNVIPYIGPYIGGIPAVIVGLSISPTTGIFVLIAIVLAQTLESYFLQPIVMGKTMKLHPVTIMLGLLLFGHFFGILGMILATPVISILKTIFQFFNEKYSIMERITDN